MTQGLSATLGVSVDHSPQLLAISYTLHITSSVPVPFEPFSTKSVFKLVSIEYGIVLPIHQDIG